MKKRKKKPLTQEQFDRMVAAVAQGVINIDVGMTNIETGSMIHRAMVDLCLAVHSGEVGRTMKEERA